MITTAKELAKWGWQLEYLNARGEICTASPDAYTLQRVPREPKRYMIPVLRKKDEEEKLLFRTFRENGKVMVKVFDESEA